MTNPKIRVLATLAVAGGLFVTSGCGGDDTSRSAPPVASVTEAGAAAGKPSTTATAERPLERDDMSNEEQNRIWAAWGRCLTDHGVPAPPAGKANQGEDVLQQPRYANAVAACESKKPESEWDRAKRTDPEYAKKFRALIQCIRDQGISVEPDGDGPGFKLTDDRQVGRGMDVAGECDRKALR
jgi:hypothetical protein